MRPLDHVHDVMTLSVAASTLQLQSRTAKVTASRSQHGGHRTKVATPWSQGQGRQDVCFCLKVLVLCLNIGGCDASFVGVLYLDIGGCDVSFVDVLCLDVGGCDVSFVDVLCC